MRFNVTMEKAIAFDTDSGTEFATRITTSGMGYLFG
jgi:hypothetical protein